MKACFWVVSSPEFREMTNQMIASVKKFYPDLPFFHYYINEVTELYQDARHYKELHKEFDTVIHINGDSIMCNKCDELFDDDFEIALPYNNGNYQDKTGMNNGIVVSNSPRFWVKYDELIEEFSKSDGWMASQNLSTTLFYSGKYKTKALSFPDKSYGIEDMINYQNIFLKDNEIYLPSDEGDKKLCIFHAAGDAWKQHGKILLDKFKDDVRLKINELIC